VVKATMKIYAKTENGLLGLKNHVEDCKKPVNFVALFKLGVKQRLKGNVLTIKFRDFRSDMKDNFLIDIKCAMSDVGAEYGRDYEVVFNE